MRPAAACRALIIIGIFALCASAPASSLLENQRELFRSVYTSAERGDWSTIEDLSSPDRQTLENYILWPDLRAAWLRANLSSIPAAKVDAFVQQYETLRPARELRYRHALNLARRDDQSGYLRIYEQFYQSHGIAELDCLALIVVQLRA